MNACDVSKLAETIKFLSSTEALAGKDGDGQVPRGMIEQYYRPRVEEAQRQCQEIELSAAVNRCHLFLKVLDRNCRWFGLKNESRFFLRRFKQNCVVVTLQLCLQQKPKSSLTFRRSGRKYGQNFHRQKRIANEPSIVMCWDKIRHASFIQCA